YYVKSVAHSAKSFKFCSSTKQACNPFRICSSKTKDLKSFRISSSRKTYTLSPFRDGSLPRSHLLPREHFFLVRPYFFLRALFCISCSIVPPPLPRYTGPSIQEVFL